MMRNVRQLKHTLFRIMLTAITAS